MSEFRTDQDKRDACPAIEDTTMRKILCVTVTTFLLSLSWLGETSGAEADATEKAILELAGARGGLAVHLGCGNGRLAGKIRSGGQWLVHGLDRDPSDVEQAREHLVSRGLYGPVSVRHWSDPYLPYADNLVNLLVAEEPHEIPPAELMRVVAPLGTVWVKKTDGWMKTVKPWPEEIDQWTHYLHDAANNPVADDSLAGPPRRIRWQAPPLWSRHHGYTPSLSALVSAGGRVFYIIDEGPSLADVRFDRWRLCARDAFNGVLLWKRPISDWGRKAWKGTQRGGGGNWNAPTTLPRRLVAVGERVYVTLGYRAPVSVLDAASGRVIETFEQTKYAEEILWDDGILIVRQRAEIPDSSGHHAWSAEAMRTAKGGPVIPPGTEGKQSIMALNAETGKTLWQWPTNRIVTLSLAACGGRVCHHNLDEIVCLDMPTGKELWRADSRAWPTRMGTAGTLVMNDRAVFFTGDWGLQAISASTGEPLWKGPRIKRSAPWQPPDLLLADGLLWGGLTPEMANCRFPQLRAPDVADHFRGERPLGIDPRDGKIVRKIEIGKLVSPGHHVRCYRSKATNRYLLYNKRGIEFVDISGGNDHARCDWTRGECQNGVVPANGLLYVTPHPCACYRGSLRNGFFAYSSERIRESEKPVVPLLEKGPAYGESPSVSQQVEAGDVWPMYRHDANRSGSTETAVPSDVRLKWRAAPGGRLTAPVIAGGQVFVASTDVHAVHCLEADSGKLVWSRRTGARIDTPPTLCAGLAVIGCRDGWVYAFRMTDGALAWRLRAAPAERLVVDDGQLESAWPVHGSVLAMNDLIYVAAGRSSFLDGGISLYAVRPETGEVVHRTRVEEPQKKVAESAGHPYWADGSEAYLLVTGSEEKHIYMAQEVFDRKLNRVEAPITDETGLRKMELHLAPMSDFTDSSWFHRTAWRYCRSWPGVPYAPEGPKSGQMLVFDDTTTYSLRAFSKQRGHNPLFTAGEGGYILCADDNDNEAVKPRGYRIQRARAPKWSVRVPVRAVAMVLAGETLFLAGPPNVMPDDDPYAALEGRRGAKLWVVSASDGGKLSERQLKAVPVFDGMAAAEEKLFISTEGGEVLCFGS